MFEAKQEESIAVNCNAGYAAAGVLNCSEFRSGMLCLSVTDEECHKIECSHFPSCSHLEKVVL